MVRVGNMGSALEYIYILATLANTQCVYLNTFPIVIMMTDHSFSIAH